MLKNREQIGGSLVENKIIWGGGVIVGEKGEASGQCGLYREKRPASLFFLSRQRKLMFIKMLIR